jgi:hypothetical protein
MSAMFLVVHVVANIFNAQPYPNELPKASSKQVDPESQATFTYASSRPCSCSNVILLPLC